MNTINKLKLAERIRSIEGLNDEERSALLGLLNESKTYGLVWEDKPEAIEERLRTELPVLKEVKSKAIISDNADAPNHIIIEGDNLESLTTLAYTHEGKIDIIYIDPPYNTGNKDFVYNDSYVDVEDSYRHSKWLSFMSKRLRIAKKLLSDCGAIFISIDDNELANLKLLCDEIFSANNFIASPVRKRRKSQANLSKNISTIHEYVLIYQKSSDCKLNKIEANIDLSEYKNPDNDPRGPYKTMPCTNKGGSKYTVITPTGHTILEEWRFKEDTYKVLLDDNRIVFPRGGAGKPRYKLFLTDKENNGVIANSWWADLESNQEGATMLKEIMEGEEVFNNPKPVGLLKFILTLGSSQNSYILDFFAGSGTTLHATMALNAEDGGSRQCILCTNNENEICEKVTYERNKRVINGYTKPNGEVVDGLRDNTLRYYRTAFVDRRRTPQNMRRLMLLASDMLCIKENLYKEHDTFGTLQTVENGLRYFAQGKKQMLIIYNEEVIYSVIEQIAQMSVEEPIIVYVFSPGNDAWNSEFVAVSEKVQLTALPSAIYNAYKRVLPKAKDASLTAEVESSEDVIEEVQLDNEDGGNE